MKKLLSLCCAFGVLLSSGLPVQAAAETNAAAQIDIAAYVEENFRREDGAAVHFLDPTEQAFCERIAGWENVTLDECILLRTSGGNLQVLTPTKPYCVQLVPEYPWRIYLTGDNLPDADKVQEKWKEMLRAEHYPEKSLEMLQCKITPAEDGYDIMCGPYEYGEITLADCLRYFPEVACADIQYAYRTDDRPNEASLFCFCFQCDRTPVPEDFPSLDIASIRNGEQTGEWELYLNNDQYSDYFAGFRTMLDSEIVKNLSFECITTKLFDDRDDAQMDLPERTVLYRRPRPLVVNLQFYEWNIDEETVKNGKGGDPAGFMTEYLLVGLAFHWNGTGTPDSAEIGGYTLTETDGWSFWNGTPAQVQSMESFAAVLPLIEHYDDCTPYVPDELMQSGLWIASGAQNAEYIEALLSDPRIDAQGLLYITEKKNAYVEADGEDDIHKQAVVNEDLSFVEISACLRPLTYAETGDVNGDGAESLTEIIRSIEEDRRCEIIPTDSPVFDCISYAVNGYTYEGVAVTCADIEALKQNGLNGIPVEWSDGFWSGYWHPSETKFLLQPIEGLSKEFGFYAKYEPSDGEELPDDGKENSFPLPTECTGLDEPVYVLYAPKADAGRLEAALAADSSVTVLGALFCGILDPMEYTGADFSVILDESAEVIDQIFRQYGFDLMETGEANRYALSEFEPDPHSFEEALALYNLFSEVEGVEKVEWYGTVVDIMPFRAAATTAKIVPFTATALKGDLDGDGSVNAYDASLVLRGANEITAGIEAANRTLTPAQEALGDVDGDGELTAFDASCILRYYNLKYVAEIEGITWADVLPQ